MDFRVRLRTFLGSEISRAHGFSREFGDSDSLVKSGLLSSLAIVDLITFIETQFGVDVADNEIEIDDFESIDNICRLLHRKAA